MNESIADYQQIAPQVVFSSNMDYFSPMKQE